MGDHHNQETHSWILKMLTYLLGVSAGVAAKIAVMYKKKPLNWRDVCKDIAVNSAIAFAAAYLVWAVLTASGHQDAAFMCSVICGRFADDVLKIGWKVFKKFLLAVSDEAKEIE